MSETQNNIKNIRTMLVYAEICDRIAEIVPGKNMAIRTKNMLEFYEKHKNCKDIA